MMTHGSVFTGIGGFDLAAEWAGFENIFHCEIDKYCQRVLKKYWPNAKQYTDIKSTNFKVHRGHIYVLSGGDPCQPHSTAGLGKGTSDDRYLWPEYDRAIEEIQPPWVVNENVSGSISNGVLDIKMSDLENKGYTCQPYCIPAEAVGALHQRERVWLVAYNPDFDRNYKKPIKIYSTEEFKELEEKRNEIHQFRQPVNLWAPDADPDPERYEKFNYSGYFGFGPDAHGNIPRNIIESGIMGMLHGLPEGMDYADRKKRIKACGNAIVPQIAYEIFKAIKLTPLP